MVKERPGDLASSRRKSLKEQLARLTQDRPDEQSPRSGMNEERAKSALGLLREVAELSRDEPCYLQDLRLLMATIYDSCFPEGESVIEPTILRDLASLRESLLVTYRALLSISQRAREIDYAPARRALTTLMKMLASLAQTYSTVSLCLGPPFIAVLVVDWAGPIWDLDSTYFAWDALLALFEEKSNLLSFASGGNCKAFLRDVALLSLKARAPATISVLGLRILAHVEKNLSTSLGVQAFREGLSRSSCAGEVKDAKTTSWWKRHADRDEPFDHLRMLWGLFPPRSVERLAFSTIGIGSKVLYPFDGSVLEISSCTASVLLSYDPECFVQPECFHIDLLSDIESAEEDGLKIRVNLARTSTYLTLDKRVQVVIEFCTPADVEGFMCLMPWCEPQVLIVDVEHTPQEQPNKLAAASEQKGSRFDHRRGSEEQQGRRSQAGVDATMQEPALSPISARQTDHPLECVTSGLTGSASTSTARNNTSDSLTLSEDAGPESCHDTKTRSRTSLRNNGSQPLTSESSKLDADATQQSSQVQSGESTSFDNSVTTTRTSDGSSSAADVSRRNPHDSRGNNASVQFAASVFDGGAIVSKSARCGVDGVLSRSSRSAVREGRIDGLSYVSDTRVLSENATQEQEAGRHQGDAPPDSSHARKPENLTVDLSALLSDDSLAMPKKLEFSFLTGSHKSPGSSASPSLSVSVAAFESDSERGDDSIAFSPWDADVAGEGCNTAAAHRTRSLKMKHKIEYFLSTMAKKKRDGIRAECNGRLQVIRAQIQQCKREVEFQAKAFAHNLETSQTTARSKRHTARRQQKEGWTAYERECEKLEVRGARLRSASRACENEQKARKTSLKAQLKERGRNLQHLCQLALSAPG